MRWDLLWEAIKLPLRLLVFAFVGFILDYAIEYLAQSQLPIAPVLSGLIIIIDKYLHELRAAESKKPLKGWNRGLLPF